MKRAPSLHASQGAFTLMEAMIGIASAATVMAAIVASSVNLQRSFYWSADYSDQSLAQLRALDFVTRDIRRARGVSLYSSGEVVVLEIPDTYSSYDAQGNPTSTPVSPTIVRGEPQYGDPSEPLWITYYRSNDTLLRNQVVTATGQTTEVAVASGIKSFRSEFIGGGNLVRSTVTFLPRMQNDPDSELRTAMHATVASRPMIIKYDDATGGGGAP